MSQMAKANGWVAKIYQIQGGDAFNNKDYATAAGVFEKGYKADPDNTATVSYTHLFRADVVSDLFVVGAPGQAGCRRQRER